MANEGAHNPSERQQCNVAFLCEHLPTNVHGFIYVLRLKNANANDAEREPGIHLHKSVRAVASVTVILAQHDCRCVAECCFFFAGRVRVPQLIYQRTVFAPAPSSCVGLCKLMLSDGDDDNVSLG